MHLLVWTETQRPKAKSETQCHCAVWFSKEHEQKKSRHRHCRSFLSAMKAKCYSILSWNKKKTKQKWYGTWQKRHWNSSGPSHQPTVLRATSERVSASECRFEIRIQGWLFHATEFELKKKNSCERQTN